MANALFDFIENEFDVVQHQDDDNNEDEDEMDDLLELEAARG